MVKIPGIAIGVVVGLAAMVVLGIAVTGANQIVPVAPEENLTPEQLTGHMPILEQVRVTANEDSVLAKLEHGDRTFTKMEFSGGDVVYFHRRTIGNIAVEGDFINFQTKDGDLRKNFTHWRDDLPANPPKINVTEDEAIGIAGGGQEASLLYISNSSAVFSRIDPVPAEPVWVVSKRDNEGRLYNSTVVSSSGGRILGYGITPFSESFVYSGPTAYTCPDKNCSGTWSPWTDQASSWLSNMTYTSESLIYPGDEDWADYLQNYDIAVIYGTAHGWSYSISSGCCESLSAGEVKNMLAEYPPVRFAFLCSCDVMYNTGPGTMAYEFRKGSDGGCVVLGYRGLSFGVNETVFGETRDWQNAFFGYMSTGHTTGYAFYYACLDIPSSSPYISYVGDPNLKLVPKIYRRDVKNAVGGEVRDVNAKKLSNVMVSLYKHGGQLCGSDMASSDYRIGVSRTGDYYLVGTNNDYYEINTVDAMVPIPPLHIDLTTPEKLAAGYVFDFEGNYGLIPRVPTMSYTLRSINLWKNPPSANPEWALDEWKAMDVCTAWLYPS